MAGQGKGCGDRGPGPAAAAPEISARRPPRRRELSSRLLRAPPRPPAAGGRAARARSPRRRAPSRRGTSPSRARRSRAESRPGARRTRPGRRARCRVIPMPSSNETFALTLITSGSQPAPIRPCASCIEKQDACAAASSSSGLVFGSVSSFRASQVSSSSGSCPLVDDMILPSPSIRPPIHSTSTCLCVAIYAITSTRRSAGVSAPRDPTPHEARESRPRAGRAPARASSIFAARGPGASRIISARLSACLPAKRISS